MTEEEMNKRIADAEARASKAEAEISDLRTQRSNQNSYITKLESKVKGLENSMETAKAAVNAAPAIAPEITEYFQKKRREDYMEQATAELIATFGEDKFNCMRDELYKFLDEYMTEKNVSVRYIIDSFHLLIGRALANPEHKIQTLMKPKEVSKVEEPINQDALNQGLANMINRTITNNDMNAGGAPDVKAPTVSNTKEALNAFRTRLMNLDSSKFE